MVKVPTIPHDPRVISRDSGRMRGSLSGWRPPHTASLEQQASERDLTQGRSGDLVANDWAAHSGVNAITTSSVGTGLQPRSRIDYKRLGITKDQGLELQADIESLWREWTPHAHVRGKLHFEDLQFLGLRTMLVQGEMLHLPVMMHGSPLCPVKLALQDIRPSRLRTPADKQNIPHLVDGIECTPYGAPKKYWIATPEPRIGHVVSLSSLTSDQFTCVPAQVGHRTGCFHLYRYCEDEQVRGNSVLSPGINLFRHLSDVIDNELLAQVIVASMPVFISREQGESFPLSHTDMGEEGEKERIYHEHIEGGTILYGNDNEKPHILENSRPSPNFATFVSFVTRAAAASLGLPYEVITKDFSQTNYSSARAALIEAWRVYLLYRKWLEHHYCQPVFSMVMEEAWLAGKLKFPSTAPDFYDAITTYTKALWIGPPRGNIDPVKEVTATAMALDNKLMTYSEALAERGHDFDETMREREAEEIRLHSLQPEPANEKTIPDANKDRTKKEHQRADIEEGVE